MKRRDFLAAGGVAVASAATGASALAQFTGSQPLSQPTTIAVNVPLTGDLILQGQQIVDGANAAVDEANRFAGPIGHYFAIRTFDDQGALAVSMENVQFAADDPTIVATVGNLTGSDTYATMPTYSNAQMPVIVPAATTDEVTAQGYRNVWRLPTKDSTEGRLFARYLAGAKKPALPIAVSQDGDYGFDVAQGFVNQANLEKMNAEAYLFPYRNPDYATAAKTILSKKPDYIYLCGTTKDMGPLVAALRVGGFNGAFGASEGFFNAATIATYADALGEVTISTSLPPVELAPSVFQLLQDFRSRYRVTALSIFGYAATQLAIDVVKRYGVTSRGTFLSAMQTGGSYDTLIGSFTFTPTGDPVDPNLYFYTIVDKQFKYQKAAHPNGFIL